jgi:hypothetical protein
MRRLMILLVVGVLAIAAAGCGGSDESSGTDTSAVTETTTEETTTEATDTEATETDTDTDTETETSGSGSFASGDCRELVQSSEELTQALSATGSGTGNLKDAAKVFQEFVDKAPDEIKADLQVLADAYVVYADALGDLDLKAGETPSPETLAKLQQAASKIDNAKVTAASQRLSTWAEENCPGNG